MKRDETHVQHIAEATDAIRSAKAYRKQASAARLEEAAALLDRMVEVEVNAAIAAVYADLRAEATLTDDLASPDVVAGRLRSLAKLLDKAIAVRDGAT